ncbi:MAG TPA: hypothetical protein VGO47_07385 [Chlamydiales bacterium]|nr:hypothetical protein [Chlamydiales bacterium]
MPSLLSADQLRTPVLYDNYQHRETYSHANYGQFWTDPQLGRNLASNLPLLVERAHVITQLCLFTQAISSVIQSKHQSYHDRKSTIPFQNQTEKEHIDNTLEKMAGIFNTVYMKKFAIQTQKITDAFQIVQAHFKQFHTMFHDSNLNLRTDAITLCKDMRKSRQKIHKLLVDINTRSNTLDRKIGPTRYQSKNEILNQYLSVAEGAQHFYRLFINVTRVLRNMEQGMAKCLEQQYNITLAIKEEDPPVVQAPPTETHKTGFCSFM